MSYLEHYGRWLPTSESALREVARRKLSDIAPHVPEHRAACVIDMGSGPGLMALALAERGYTNIISFDSDAGQVEAGRQLQVAVRHVPTADTAQFLEPYAGKADLFLLLDVLEHIPVPKQVAVLSLIRRTLAPGGTLLVQVPNADSPVGLRYRYSDWTHHCAFTFESLTYVLQQAGFTVADVEESPRHRLGAFGAGPRALAWFLLSCGVRGAVRLKMLPFVGREVALGAPLSCNIRAVAQPR